MTTGKRLKQSEEVLVKFLHRQDRATDKRVRVREEQSELNAKVVRVENRLERVEGKLGANTRKLPELLCDSKKYQQKNTAGLAHIVELIRVLK